MKWYKNISYFNQQGLEKYNDQAPKDYFQSSNHRDSEALQQMIFLKNRIQYLEAKKALSISFFRTHLGKCLAFPTELIMLITIYASCSNLYGKNQWPTLTKSFTCGLNCNQKLNVPATTYWSHHIYFLLEQTIFHQEWQKSHNFFQLVLQYVAIKWCVQILLQGNLSWPPGSPPTKL